VKEIAVYRQLALPVSVFDRIKDVQRACLSHRGEQLTLAETVSRIVREHQQNEVREGRSNDQEHRKAAVLR
jgi:hypothetical protein